MLENSSCHCHSGDVLERRGGKKRPVFDYFFSFLFSFLPCCSDGSDASVQTCEGGRAQPLQGAAAGEHNLPLVLSNLHFPWSLREVRVSSCFPPRGLGGRGVGGAYPTSVHLGLHPRDFFKAGKRKCSSFFPPPALLRFSADSSGRQNFTQVKIGFAFIERFGPSPAFHQH